MPFGGKIGFFVFLATAISLLYFGWVAWGRLGTAVRKVFRQNDSTNYDTRAEFYLSRFAVIEKAAADRRFGFFSPSTPGVLKVYREGETLVLDASDVRGVLTAHTAAKDLAFFQQPGADLENLRLRFPPPRDPARLAEAADALFVNVLDGTPEHVEPDQIRFEPLSK
jgi:hypothetical protein